MGESALRTVAVMSPAEKIRRANLTLFYRHHTHRLFCPNTTTVFYWEADLVSLTRAGLTHEYEIKCSRSDFLADFKKDKHRMLAEMFETGKVQETPPQYLIDMYEKHGEDPKVELAHMYEGEMKDIPNYFWYICIDFEPKEGEIPEYAGLMLLDSLTKPYRPGVLAMRGKWKDAPRIHRGKIGDKQKEHLYGSINARYWKWVEGAYQSI